LKFEKLNDLEWALGRYRVVRVEGIDGPVYEIWLGQQYLTEFSNFSVVKTYIGFDSMKREAA
jgi:hypothetical protein